MEQEGQGEVCPSCNYTCPIVEPCPEIEQCPPCETCPEETPCQAPEDCPPVKECPKPKEKHCPEVKSCLPCPTFNQTSRNVECPTPPVCPGDSGLSLPAAMAVGAVTGIMVTGMAAVVGLILRYVSPLVSGFLFLATIIIMWYLCSHYPDTARELGGRAAILLREAAVALSHRVMAVIQRHQEQVGVLVKPNLFFRMSSMFHLEKFALRFSM